MRTQLNDDRLIASLLAEVFLYRELLSVALEQSHAKDREIQTLTKRLKRKALDAITQSA